MSSSPPPPPSSSSSSSSPSPSSPDTSASSSSPIQIARPGPRALSNRESDELMKQLKSHALKECDDVVRQFAECAQGRTVSVAWACRGKYKEVQSCLGQYTSAEAVDKARKEWLDTHR